MGDLLGSPHVAFFFLEKISSVKLAWAGASKGWAARWEAVMLRRCSIKSFRKK
ncbi:hypothetical protein AXF42_Ash017952 [Apostasia shenzhenica]|uniref:Uncharacterized protein n=1 Tax=Apostasia shenzhenica TaxID=1088818 RepID=A0A2I0A500_9ASPA|nr:hypothetical protein AXF42_Ash017952 [Apostasia shenzhenica]